MRLAGWIIAVHLVEIVAWGVLYAWRGAMPDLQAAFYFSAVTYTTTDIILWERTRELATLRTLGFSIRRMALLVTIENLGVALTGALPGWVLTIGGFALTDEATWDPWIPFWIRDTGFNVVVLAAFLVAWGRARKQAIGDPGAPLT